MFLIWARVENGAKVEAKVEALLALKDEELLARENKSTICPWVRDVLVSLSRISSPPCGPKLGLTLQVRWIVSSNNA